MNHSTQKSTGKRRVSLEAIGRHLHSRRFFTLYFGFGIPPALFGGVGVAFRLGAVVGIVVAALVAAWIVETFATVCRRCPFYGTARCGLPSLLVPLLFTQRSPYDLPRRRIAIHRGLDLAMIVLMNAIYLIAFPPLFPVIAVCSAIGWLVVFVPKRFHGLSFRLRNDARTHDRDHLIPGNGTPVAVAVKLRPARTTFDAAVPPDARGLGDGTAMQ